MSENIKKSGWSLGFDLTLFQEKHSNSDGQITYFSEEINNPSDEKYYVIDSHFTPIRRAA